MEQTTPPQIQWNEEVYAMKRKALEQNEHALGSKKHRGTSNLAAEHRRKAKNRNKRKR